MAFVEGESIPTDVASLLVLSALRRPHDDESCAPCPRNPSLDDFLPVADAEELFRLRRGETMGVFRGLGEILGSAVGSWTGWVSSSPTATAMGVRPLLEMAERLRRDGTRRRGFE